MSATRPWTSGSSGSEFGENAAEAQGVFAERGPDPVVACSGGVALVEDQVHDLRGRRRGARELVAARDLEGDVGLGECALGADDALGDGGLGEEEGAGDLVGSEAAEKTERERDA